MFCYLNGSDPKVSPNYSQKWLIFILFVWLLFSIARQTFDLIGKLWIPVAFNLLQVLSCITGLFAAFQCRFGLLIALSISTCFSVIYNILIILWYGDFFGVGWRESDLLSAGLPFGHSFFLRHTPFCDAAAYFNLTASRWQQHSTQCFLSYNNIEQVQAGLHVLLAFLTLVFSIWMLINSRKIKITKCKKKNSALSNLNYGIMACSTMRSKRISNASMNKKKRLSGRGRVSENGVVIPQLNSATGLEHIKTPQKILLGGIEFIPPDSNNDFNNGYMNSTYDKTVIATNDYQTQKQDLLYKRLNQRNLKTEKQSTKNHSTFQQQSSTRQKLQGGILRKKNFRKNDTFTVTDLPENIRKVRNLDEYSCATTAEINGTQHSNSNSTSSGFEMSSNSTMLQDPSLPPPPFFASNFGSQSVNSSKYIENHVVENKKQQSNENNYGDSDIDSMAYSQIELDQTIQNKKQFNAEVKAGDCLCTQSNSAYGSTRIFTSRNNVTNGGSTRYYNAKIKSQNSNMVYGNFPTKFFDASNSTSKDSNSMLYSKFKPSATEISRPYSSLANSIHHQRQLSDSVLINESDENSGYVEFLNRNPGSNRRSSTTKLTSLISFDPKSNTLIRVREHQNSDSEDEHNTVNKLNQVVPNSGWRDKNMALPICSNSNSNLVFNSNLKSFDNLTNLSQRSESRDSVPSIKAPVLITDSQSQIFENPNTSSGSLTSSNLPLIRQKVIPQLYSSINNKNEQNDSFLIQKNDSSNWISTNSNQKNNLLTIETENTVHNCILQPIYNEQKSSFRKTPSTICNFFNLLSFIYFLLYINFYFMQ